MEKKKGIDKKLNRQNLRFWSVLENDNNDKILSAGSVLSKNELYHIDLRDSLGNKLKTAFPRILPLSYS